MFEIDKKDIYIGSLVGQTYQTPVLDGDILCIGKNNSIFAYDLDDAILIKSGDYYVNLECIGGYFELQKFIKKDIYNNSYSKNKALSIESLKKIVDEDDKAFQGQFFIVKESLKPFDYKYLLDEGLEINLEKNSYSFKELKSISNRLIKRRNGIDNLPVIDQSKYHL